MATVRSCLNTEWSQSGGQQNLVSTMFNLQFLSQSVGMTLLLLQRPLWSLKQQHLRWLLKLHVPSRLLIGDQRWATELQDFRMKISVIQLHCQLHSLLLYKLLLPIPFFFPILQPMQKQAVDKNECWDVVTCHRRPGRQTIPEPQPEFGDCFLAWLLKFPAASLFDMRRDRIAGPQPLQEKQSPRREGGWRGVEDRIQKPNWGNQAGNAGCGSGGTTEIKV